LAIFCLASVTDNPSDSGHLVVIAIVWFALAAARHPESRQPAATGGAVRIASFAAAIVIAFATVSLLGASWEYDQARSKRADGDEAAVRGALSRAAGLDPGFALYQRELGLALLADGALEEAADRLEKAIDLNRADLTALRAQAYVRLLMVDAAAARTHANRALELGGSRAVNSVMSAFVAQSSGHAVAAEEALVHALRLDPWLSASPGWREVFPIGDALQGLLTRASDSWMAGSDPSGRNTMAQAWIHGMVGRPSGTTAAALAATNAIIRCDMAGADAIIRDLTDAERSSVSGLIAHLMEARIRDSDPTDLLLRARLRWPLLGHLATAEQSPMSPFTDPDEDARIYRRLGMPSLEFGPLLPTSNAGLSAWLRDPVAAADVGAPGSGLAGCR
jgi:tetratricopeptide (TPR) repeat protein